MKETIKKAGYTFLRKEGSQYLLLNKDTNIIEVFAANKNHASWGLIYKNTHLEFCSSRV